MLTIFLEEWLFHFVGEYELKEKIISQGEDEARERCVSGKRYCNQKEKVHNTSTCRTTLLLM